MPIGGWYLQRLNIQGYSKSQRKTECEREMFQRFRRGVGVIHVSRLSEMNHQCGGQWTMIFLCALRWGENQMVLVIIVVKYEPS